MSFVVGDSVQLKGGSPVMTVVVIGSGATGNVDTVWFEGAKEFRGTYPAQALVKYDPGTWDID